ncbi:lysylphosphatidylglycerol synthase transmembrane domain-containing protein [soil metagenome]
MALEGTEVVRDDDDLLSGPAWGRHPTDIVRLILAGAALVVLVLLATRHAGEVRSVAVDLVNLVNQLPRWLRDLLLGTTQLLAIVVPVLLVVVLVRTPKLLAIALGAAIAAAGIMATIQTWLDDAVPSQVVRVTERPSWIIGAAFPSGAYLAGFTAVLIVQGPVLSRGWRRAAFGGLGIAVLSRVVSAVAVPLNVAVTLTVGAVVGSAALVVLGSPRRTASRRAVLTGLARAGFPADRIEACEVGANHARTFVATTGSGRRAFIKLLGRDERDAYLILRILKVLRVKDLDDLRPSWSPGDLVEHEAFSALLAARTGASVPQVLAAGTTRGGDGLVVMEVIAGGRLSALPLEAVTDELLDQVWAQVALLHRQGMAHRWLTSSQILVDPAATEPEVTLVDFRWVAHQADAHQLAADVAMLTTSLALIVGADRSVAAVARALGEDELAAALPLVQPLAMPSDVRDAIGDQKHVLPAVRSRLQAAAGGVDYQLADIERVNVRQLAGLAGAVVAVYTLLSFASSWSEITHAMGQVSLWSLPGLVVLAAIPYLAGAATFMSVAPQRLPYGEVVRLMVGQSFLNRFTPANAGGMALRVRYLQKRGGDLGTAAAGVALTSVASGIGQVAVLATFAAWAGSSAGGLHFSLPRASTAAVALLAVAVLGGLVWLTPWGRRVVGRRIETTVRQVWTTLRNLSRQPARFLTLFSTTIASKVAMIAAFSEASRAVDISLSFPKLGLLYLTASSLASAAPTPGGVGAVEAALTAALTGAGVPATDALSAVFLFRLVTYWLPVPFGWWSLHRLQRTVLA